MNSRVVAVVALCASLFSVAGVAQAAPVQKAEPTQLVLTVQYSEVDDNRVERAWLDCDGGDSHPRTTDACQDLDAARGSLAAMSADDRPCPFIYAPVEAKMNGLYRGEWVSQTRTFSNSCVMVAHTGALFAF